MTGAGDAIAALLESCDSPRELATSRSPLDLPGESLVVLGPLVVPAPGTSDVDNDAVRLFLERARDAGTSIAADLDAVALLCRRLDGVPLALELAAARTRSMQPEETDGRLVAGVDVLTRPGFAGPVGIGACWTRLPGRTACCPRTPRHCSERLGAFPGPFTAELAVAVGAHVGLDPAVAQRALRLLVDSSLVVVDRLAAGTRSRPLESMRMFALQRLSDQGVLDEAQRRLADHVVAAASDLPQSVEGHDRHRPLLATPGREIH